MADPGSHEWVAVRAGRARRWRTRIGPRAGGRALVTVTVLVVAACGPAAAPHRRAVPPRPTAIIPTAASLRSGTAPAPNGLLWVLAGTGGVRALHAVDIVSRADRGVVPVPGSAVAVAEAPGGPLALGLATATTGAVQLRNAATGALLGTVPVTGPVRAIAAGTDGTTFYVLTATSRAATVSVVVTPADRVEGILPAPLGAVALGPDPAEGAVWLLQANGLVDEVAVTGGKLTTQFRVGRSGLALALSPDGATLYVLKGVGPVRNVAVVDLATESVRRVLPAPADTVGLALSPGGGTLYDLVGTPRVGSIQAYRLTG